MTRQRKVVGSHRIGTDEFLVLSCGHHRLVDEEIDDTRLNQNCMRCPAAKPRKVEPVAAGGGSG